MRTIVSPFHTRGSFRAFSSNERGKRTIIKMRGVVCSIRREEGGGGRRSWVEERPSVSNSPSFLENFSRSPLVKGNRVEGRGIEKKYGGRELGLGFLISLESRKIDRTMINANRIADVVTGRIYLLYPLAQSYYPS